MKKRISLIRARRGAVVAAAAIGRHKAVEVVGYVVAEAEEELLPPERRKWPAVKPLEERFGDLDSVRLTALRRLFRIPAPDLAALSLKLDLAVADQAWELEGCETCLEAMADDARRLTGAAS